MLSSRLSLRSLPRPARAAPLGTAPLARAWARTCLSAPAQRRAYTESGFDPNSHARAKDRAAVGVFTPRAAALFVAAGVGLFVYFRHEKAQLLARRQAALESRTVGRAHVGGPFALTTHTGAPFTEADLLGKWSLVYFGFTHCPDICPAELDKIGRVVEELEKANIPTQPLFITVDPARDPAAQLRAYLADFHPALVGLGGDYAATKAVCRAYRVYFSTPPDADAAGDYLVDHSIFVYLMDPRGAFVEAFGQAVGAAEVVARVRREVAEWEAREGK